MCALPLKITVNEEYSACELGGGRLVKTKETAWSNGESEASAKTNKQTITAKTFGYTVKSVIAVKEMEVLSSEKEKWSLPTRME